MLEVSNLRVHYGGIEALKGVSLRLAEGEIVGVVGPNGAGKSTLLWAITGMLMPSAGSIDFERESLLGKAPEEIVRKGIALVPEGRQVFQSLTVEENLRLGAMIRRDRGAAKRDLDEMLTLFPSLERRYRTTASQLSGGEQQQLAIARAMLSRPRLLLLDEPSLGLAPMVVELVLGAIEKLRNTGISIMLVEQMALSTVKLADRSYIFRSGTVVLNGKRTELMGNPEIVSAYLGG